MFCCGLFKKLLFLETTFMIQNIVFTFIQKFYAIENCCDVREKFGKRDGSAFSFKTAPQSKTIEE